MSNFFSFVYMNTFLHTLSFNFSSPEAIENHWTTSQNPAHDFPRAQTLNHADPVIQCQQPQSQWTSLKKKPESSPGRSRSPEVVTRKLCCSISAAPEPMLIIGSKQKCSPGRSKSLEGETCKPCCWIAAAPKPLKIIEKGNPNPARDAPAAWNL